MQAESKIYNLRRSFNRYLHDNLAPTYYINYQDYRDSKIKQYNKWLDIAWLHIDSDYPSMARVQLNCCSIIAKDKYGNDLNVMVDEVMSNLNVNSIALYDYAIVGSPVDLTPSVIIPRYRESRPLAAQGNDTVAVIAIDYNLFWFRPDVIN